MIKVNPETINGKLVTVIRKPFDAEWVREQLSMKVPVVAEMYMADVKKFPNAAIVSDVLVKITAYKRVAGVHWSHKIRFGHNTLVILPPLPRYPEPEDAPLLYRYMAEGFDFCGIYEPDDACTYVPKDLYIKSKNLVNCLKKNRVEIAHCLLNGERVEVAIKG